LRSRRTGPSLLGAEAAQAGRVERHPQHVRLPGGLGAAGILGVSQPGFGFAGFAFEPGEQPGLATGAGRCGVFSGPAGAGGDLGAQAALFGGKGLANPS
jgi:hypothetical protein